MAHGRHLARALVEQSERYAIAVTRNHCYFVDSEGRVYDPTPSRSVVRPMQAPSLRWPVYAT